MIPIIEDWDFFQLSGTFSGPSHPNNQGPTVLTPIKETEWTQVKDQQKICKTLKIYFYENQNNIKLLWNGAESSENLMLLLHIFDLILFSVLFP